MNVTDITMLQWRNMQNARQVENKPQTEQGKLKEACEDFEAIFIKQMLDAMKKTVPQTDLFGRNMAQDIFEDMLYDEYSKSMSKSANLGIADMMFTQLSQKDTVKP